MWYHLAWRGEEGKVTKRNKRAKKGMGGEAGIVGKRAALIKLRKLPGGTQNRLSKSESPPAEQSRRAGKKPSAI